MADRPTLRSVAQAAGVSTATVSYAFNRPGRISQEARDRILSVARELGYAGPDARGRSLRTGRAGAIGVLLTAELTYALTDPYVLELLGGLAEELAHTRTCLVLIPFPQRLHGLGEDELREALDAVHRAVIDAAVTDGLPPGHPAIRVLADRKIPLVHSAEDQAGADRCVVIDDQQVGRVIGEHLAGLGHRDVAMIVGCAAVPGRPISDPDHADLFPYGRRRLAGLREFFPDCVVVSGGRNTTASGRAAAAALLDRPAPPTAIAADSDVLALGALGEARRREHDVSVVGVDDIPAAEGVGLTTVRQPVREKGRIMGRMLLDPDFTQTRVLLPVELVIRETTRPVARRSTPHA